MDNIRLMFENPTRKRSKKVHKKASKKRKKGKNLYVPKRKLRKGTTTRPRRKKRLMGGANAILPVQTTQGRKKRTKKGTVGSKRRNRRGTVGRKRHYTTSGVTMGSKRRNRRGTVGRRRTTKGTMGFLNFKNIFDELLSAGSVAIGGLGGLVATSYVTSALFGKTDATTGATSITYSDSILGGLVSFGVLHLAENYVRPGGMAGNLFTGAKVFSIFSVLMKLKGLFIDGKEWTQEDYIMPKDSDIIGTRVPQTLKGGLGAYLVEDDASVINLGSNKITSTMLGANKIMPNTMLGAGRSEINEAVNNLMTMHGASTKNTFESAFRPA